MIRKKKKSNVKPTSTDINGRSGNRDTSGNDDRGNVMMTNSNIFSLKKSINGGLTEGNERMIKKKFVVPKYKGNTGQISNNGCGNGTHHNFRNNKNNFDAIEKEFIDNYNDDVFHRKRYKYISSGKVSTKSGKTPSNQQTPSYMVTSNYN